MYQYEPLSERKKAKNYVLIFGLLGVMALGIGRLWNNYLGIFYTAAIIFFCLVVLVVNKYVIKRTIYRIDENGENLDLSVFEVQKKSSICVFRMSLANLNDVSKYGEKKFKGYQKYNYCVDMFDKDCYCLDFIEGSDKTVVFIKPDEKLLEIFNANKKA